MSNPIVPFFPFMFFPAHTVDRRILIKNRLAATEAITRAHEPQRPLEFWLAAVKAMYLTVTNELMATAIVVMDANAVAKFNKSSPFWSCKDSDWILLGIELTPLPSTGYTVDSFFKFIDECDSKWFSLTTEDGDRMKTLCYPFTAHIHYKGTIRLDKYVNVFTGEVRNAGPMPGAMLEMRHKIEAEEAKAVAENVNFLMAKKQAAQTAATTSSTDAKLPEKGADTTTTPIDSTITDPMANLSIGTSDAHMVDSANVH